MLFILLLTILSAHLGATYPEVNVDSFDLLSPSTTLKLSQECRDIIALFPAEKQVEFINYLETALENDYLSTETKNKLLCSYYTRFKMECNILLQNESAAGTTAAHIKSLCLEFLKEIAADKQTYLRPSVAYAWQHPSDFAKVGALIFVYRTICNHIHQRYT